VNLSDMVRAMAAAGCSGDQIAKAVSEMDEQRRAKARAGNAERQRRHRNANNTVTERDAALLAVSKADETSPKVSPQEIYNQPPILTPSTSLRSETTAAREPKKSTARGCRLPFDWKPCAEGRLMAGNTLGNSEARAELEKFKDYWASQPGARGVKADWDATWRNWVRKAAEGGQPRAGPAQRPQTARNFFAQVGYGGLEHDEFTDGTMGKCGGGSDRTAIAGPRGGDDGFAEPDRTARRRVVDF
jgi:hypothetical protein